MTYQTFTKCTKMYFRRTHSAGPVAGLRTKSNSVAKFGLFFELSLNRALISMNRAMAFFPFEESNSFYLSLLLVAEVGLLLLILLALLLGPLVYHLMVTRLKILLPVLLDDLVALEMKVMTGIEILEYRTVERI